MYTVSFNKYLLCKYINSVEVSQIISKVGVKILIASNSVMEYFFFYSRAFHGS